MGTSQRVFIFGESEKGRFCNPLKIRDLADLLDRVGNPPASSQGVDCAIQALHYDRELIFYRVREEGYSFDDYMMGVKLLYKQGTGMNLSAICLPGVGDRETIEAISPLCQKFSALLLMSERDLYDYLTVSKY